MMELQNNQVQVNVQDEFFYKAACIGSWLNYYRLIAVLLMASSAATTIVLVKWVLRGLA